MINFLPALSAFFDAAVAVSAAPVETALTLAAALEYAHLPSPTTERRDGMRVLH